MMPAPAFIELCAVIAFAVAQSILPVGLLKLSAAACVPMAINAIAYPFRRREA